MKKLYFIRHGESEFNKSSTWSGDTDTHLTDTGREQAQEAGRQCRTLDIKPDLIIASPLSRAYDTARLVAEEIGYPPDKILVDKNIIERSFGSLEGRKDLVANTKYLHDETAIDEYEGVEKLADLQKRADDFLNYLESLPQETVLVVGHGAFGRALRRSVNKEPLPKAGKLKVFDNGQVICFI